MSNFKLTVHLKQITPLLHFQGDTEGACLRASEVKPKLDKFIVNYLGKENIPDSWKLSVPVSEDGTKHEAALQYKMRFEGIGEIKTLCNYKDRYRRNEIHPLYFASMGDDAWDENGESKVKGVYYSKGIKMTLVSVKCPELLQKIMPLIAAFFALNCFGSRSNKGFGSFQVETINRERKGCFINPQKLASHLHEDVPALYYVQYPTRGYPSASMDDSHQGAAYLDDIQTLSALMKGGINYSHGKKNNLNYFKGAIFQYMMQNNEKLHSEKALIKRDVLPCEKEDAEVRKLFKKADLPSDDSEFIYMRSVLGLTESFTYKRDERKRDGQIIKINPHSYREGTVTVEDTEKDDKGKSIIHRFENPIHFKPYGCYILIIPQAIPSKLLGAKFCLSGKIGNKKAGSTMIQMPKHFDLDDFLSFFSQLYQNDSKIQALRNAQMNSYHPQPIDKVISTVQKIKTINRAVRFTEGGN